MNANRRPLPEVLGALSEQPDSERCATALEMAAELIQFAAYEAALLAKRSHIAELMTLSAEVEQWSKVFDEKTEK